MKLDALTDPPFILTIHSMPAATSSVGCKFSDMHFVVRFVAAALLIAVTGCGHSGRVEIARVGGAVTLDGAPYTQGGTVFFQPETIGKMATGAIQSDGTYVLSIYGSSDGAAVGKNRVVILPPPQVTDERSEGQLSKSANSHIPTKYGSPATSGLVFDVLAGEANEFPIELKSK